MQLNYFNKTVFVVRLKFRDYKPGKMVGCLKILNNIIKGLIIEMSDIKHNSKWRYGIWNSGGFSLEEGSIQCFTDGSKTNKGTGIGIVGSNYKLFNSFGHSLLYFKQNCRRNRREYSIYIFVRDSQVVLKTLRSTCLELFGNS